MNKKIIIIIIAIILAFILINGISSLEEFTEKIPLMQCLDYDYTIQFEESELPVTITFYTLNPEEFFKKEIVTTDSITTHLHCGHDYKVIYEFEGYEPFTDYFSIPDYNPLIYKTTKISVKNG